MKATRRKITMRDIDKELQIYFWWILSVASLLLIANTAHDLGVMEMSTFFRETDERIMYLTVALWVSRISLVLSAAGVVAVRGWKSRVPFIVLSLVAGVVCYFAWFARDVHFTF